MDAKLFRLPTKPNLYGGGANPFDVEEQQKRTELPTEDSRFPGWAAPMADGRLVTEYQNHCSRNIPSGQQFATKEWMTKNALELIRLSRERLSYQTGSIYGLNPNLVPPPATLVKCETHDCSRTPTGAQGGIGLERADSITPELFGTWDPVKIDAVQPLPQIEVTQQYEGGRNTPRGAA